MDAVYMKVLKVWNMPAVNQQAQTMEEKHKFITIILSLLWPCSISRLSRGETVVHEVLFGSFS